MIEGGVNWECWAGIAGFVVVLGVGIGAVSGNPGCIAALTGRGMWSLVTASAAGVSTC